MTYYADMEKLRNVWPAGPSPVDAEDLFRVTINLGANKNISADTHLFENQHFCIVPYADFDSMSRDADGKKHPTGDAALADFIAPGELVFAIKHHRCKHRYLDQHTSSADLKEHLKLQDTHIQIAIGVTDRGRGHPGVVTLNSPQSYGGEANAPGRFGAASYPMIFVKPNFPDYLPEHCYQPFIDNIRTMAVAFNAVACFPDDGRYNGGDPLAACTPALVRSHVKQMILAIAAQGQTQRDAIGWFSQPNNLIYCAEYAFLVATAGVLCPLNTTHIEPLVGAEVCARFFTIIDRHDSGHVTPLTADNPNKLIKTVATTLAPDDLSPIPAYAPAEQQQAEKAKLAFLPLTPADIVDHAIRIHFDRKKYGESIAKVQASVMQKMQPGFIEMLQLDKKSTDPTHREAAISSYTRLMAVVATEHSSYQQFRTELAPAFEAVKKLTSGRVDSDSKLYVPPSLFHLVARKEHHGGLLSLDYLGHGFHLSLVHQ